MVCARPSLNKKCSYDFSNKIDKAKCDSASKYFEKFPSGFVKNFEPIKNLRSPWRSHFLNDHHIVMLFRSNHFKPTFNEIFEYGFGEFIQCCICLMLPGCAKYSLVRSDRLVAVRYGGNLNGRNIRSPEEECNTHIGRCQFLCIHSKGYWAPIRIWKIYPVASKMVAAMSFTQITASQTGIPCVA